MELLKNLEGMSADEQMSAVVELQKAAMKTLEEQKQASIGKSAEMVIQGLKKIKADFEAKFDSLNYDIQTKVSNLKDGQQGLQGQKGEAGDRGLDGAQGRDGKSGLDGKNGLDGKDGVSVQDAKIDFDGSLVITLSDGREINVGEVVPVDVAQTIHKIQSGSGGDSQTTLNAIAALQATIATYGTMATQNANNVAITGGTINGTTVGATTPATGVFTTLTAQTEVLKGTGQNLFLQSQTFNNASWTKNNASITTAATTAPDSTNTGQKLVEDSATSLHYVSQSPVIVGSTITVSVYAKQSERTRLLIRENSNTGAYSVFDVSTGSVITNSGIATGSIVSVGNGWYRCSITATFTASGSTNFGIFLMPNAGTLFADATYAGNGTSGLFIWGSQLEIGSVLNTYIPTTTTAVYGTPTLSFSGVSTIGLESNGSLFVQPAGTGALQAQATTSSAVGGNARGANAVDWQTSRVSASQVANGSNSFIGGGKNNTASGFSSVLTGGDSNQATSSYTSVNGGTGNTGSGAFAFVGGGQSNTSSKDWSVIVGGNANTSAGYYNLIGGGFTNAGTSGSAVTTQSSTMNGTTAVTLAASNANIKVGQYITGTSIAADTYVAAISGTSLTLSKVASGSSTSTLSFFTPHGVVVGGGNNQATGSYSFIGGGGDAGTAANRNVASGDWSVVGGGFKNTASASGATICGGGTFGGGGGGGNTASGLGAFVGAGWSNTSSGTGASVIGVGNTANSSYSTALGLNATTRAIVGNIASSACETPIGSGVGIHQTALLVLARQTTDATTTVLTSNASAASTTNQVILPNNSAYYFKGSVIANVTGAANGASWSFEGAIMRGANAASTVLIDTPSVNRVASSAGATAWVVALSADTTNGGLAVTVTGAASTTIRWVCRAETCEVTF